MRSEENHKEEKGWTKIKRNSKLNWEMTDQRELASSMEEQVVFANLLRDGKEKCRKEKFFRVNKKCPHYSVGVWTLKTEPWYSEL